MFHSQHILDLHFHPGLQKSNFTILFIWKSNEDTLLLKHGGLDSLSNLVFWSLPVFGRRGRAALTPGGGGGGGGQCRWWCHNGTGNWFPTLKPNTFWKLEQACEIRAGLELTNIDASCCDETLSKQTMHTVGPLLSFEGLGICCKLSVKPSSNAEAASSFGWAMRQSARVHQLVLERPASQHPPTQQQQQQQQRGHWAVWFTGQPPRPVI